MYLFALKIIFSILNKSTQYLSFITIALFLTFFLLIKQSLMIYEVKFIDSLKGLYPEFVTTSVSTLKKLKEDGVSAVPEIFVYSEEILFSYDEDEEIAKFMNVRTFDKKHKDALFSTITLLSACKETEKTVWLSNRLYDNMIQDNAFNKESLFFMDSDDNYQDYNICIFKLDNNEKWLVTSTKNAKKMAYMPLASRTIYTNDFNVKEKLYHTKKVYNWKKYIDYDDLGIFLLAKHVSKAFLVAFFIFLMIFMIITFSSLAKELESSIFLQKMYGMNFTMTVFMLSSFFTIYTFFLLIATIFFYKIFVFTAGITLHIQIVLDMQLLMNLTLLLIFIGIIVSTFITKKYHKLPL